jgi:hypothetical protein
MAFSRTPRTVKSKDPRAVATHTPSARCPGVIRSITRVSSGAGSRYLLTTHGGVPCWMHGIEQNIIATSRRSVAASPQAPSPAPWRIVEIAHGFAVDDAAGRQLGIFHGRDDSNTAGYTGFLTIDEARQMAVDFAGLPELLKRAAAL